MGGRPAFHTGAQNLETLPYPPDIRNITCFQGVTRGHTTDISDITTPTIRYHFLIGRFWGICSMRNSAYIRRYATLRTGFVC